MSDVRATDEGDPLNEVNVIPLADLSLVLLIILMVMSPMIMQSMIKVQSSKAAAAQNSSDVKEPPIILALSPNYVSLNTVKITDDVDLASRLAIALGNREDKTVMFTADAAVPHGRFVRVLDLVKQQGAEKIALLKKAK